jgi:hypothetical protein
MTEPYRVDARKKVYCYLTGATDKRASQLAPLSKSWNSAPELTVTEGKYLCKGYEKFERAYVLAATDDEQGHLRGTIKASPDRPVQNLVISIQRWGNENARIEIDGNDLPRGQYRVGHERTLEGTNLIVFIELSTSHPFSITITKE